MRGSDHIGSQKTGRRKAREYVPQTDDPAVPRGAVFVHGVLLTAKRMSLGDARDLFPPGPDGLAQFDAHLDALGERLRAAIPPTPKSGRAHKSRLTKFHAGGEAYRFDALRVVDCAGCGRTLLGPSDEPLREQVRSEKLRKRLPPPVAGRVADRPTCERCLPGG